MKLFAGSRQLLTLCVTGGFRGGCSAAGGMTKVVSIRNHADQVALEQVLSEAGSVLGRGGVIAVPTETIYGIATSVDSSEGIERVYTIKGRNTAKPIAICLSDVQQIDGWAQRTVSHELLNELLPGPVTAVFERTEQLNPRLNPDTPLVGIRIPAHSFMRELVVRCGYPLALTSANISNTRSSLAVEEFQELWPQLDLVVDGGRIAEGEGEESRRGSTVVNLSQPGRFSVIRRGSSYEHTVHILRDKHRLTEVI